MKIYLDVLFICNLIITLLMLELVSLLSNRKLKRTRKMYASLLGGISSLISIFSSESYTEALLTVIIKLVFISLIVYIAIGKTNLKSFIRFLLSFLTANILLGGCCLLLSDILPGKSLRLINGSLYFHVGLPILFLTLILIYLGFTVTEKTMKHKFYSGEKYTASFAYGDYSITMPALCDTGNQLKDSFSGENVVIFQSRTLYHYFELDDMENNSISGFHLIPCSTISGRSIIPVTLKAKVTVYPQNSPAKEIRCAAGITDSDDREIAIFNPCIML
ncbi:MAG: sigma-E processing peptidase SpoIIGA [Ruminococcus sp.]|nr:sigma-E processing peptidase SpoIIGA [Ruminococcus sp.]